MTSTPHIRDRLIDVLVRKGDELTASQIRERFGSHACAVALGIERSGLIERSGGVYRRSMAETMARRARTILAELEQSSESTIAIEALPDLFRDIEFDERADFGGRWAVAA